MTEHDLFRERLSFYQTTIEEALPLWFLQDNQEIDRTKEAALYSLRAGGKRIRPALFLGTADMLGVSLDVALPFACAIEMIHTYSLIHDDLPCMDNDDFRRGKPTCHVQFSEAIALLAGDALLNRAYEICLKQCLVDDDRKSRAKAGYFLSRMAGSDGMIGGQTIDILSEGQMISSEKLHELHAKKTGCLLKAPVMIPFLLSEYDDVHPILRHNLDEYASHVGLAFQIKDDLLDVTSTKEILGKSIGKDAADNKSTFVTIFGEAKATKYLEDEIDAAGQNLTNIKNMGFSVSFLEGITEYLFKRDR